MTSEERYKIEIVDVALHVIDFLHASGREPQGASDIARGLGISRSRAFRILKTLEGRGYVESVSQTDGYQLGIKFVEIGEQIRNRLDIRMLAKPILENLAQETGDSINLVVIHGKSAVILDTYRGHHRLQIEDQIGMTIPFHVGACPKILLAYLPEKERENLIHELTLDRYTAETITDRDELRRVLKKVRIQGYAVDEGDFELGVCSIGAPIRDHNGRVFAGISVTTPMARYDPSRRDELIKVVLEASRQVSALSGWREPHPLDRAPTVSR